MPLDLEAFQRMAGSTWFGSRDILVNEQDEKAKLGNLFFSSGAKANDAAMNAFRSALSQKLGVFGEHAFDTVLGSRMQMHKSLRACDVRSVLSALEAVRKHRYIGEINRQLDIDPSMLELPEPVQTRVRSLIAAAPLAGAGLQSCRDQDELARRASARIASAIEDAVSEAEQQNIEIAPRKITGNIHVEEPVRDNGPTGLRDLSISFGRYDNTATSVEDRMKKGNIGVGMAINRSHSSPMILDKLKTNGVEPGFICRSDWSRSDTYSMMADIDSAESRAALDALKLKYPGIAEKCAGLDRRGLRPHGERGHAGDKGGHLTLVHRSAAVLKSSRKSALE